MPRERTSGDRSSSHRAGSSDQGAPAAQTRGGLDRRALIAAAGGAIVAGVGGQPAAAQEARPLVASSRRIDAHTHFSSLKVLEALEKEEGKPFVLGRMYRSKPALTEPAARLAILDHNEIDIHVLVPVPGSKPFRAWSAIERSRRNLRA